MIFKEDKKNIKKIKKYFVIIFILSFLVINWNDISWIFNYRVVLNYFSDFLKTNQEENIAVAKNRENNIENTLEIPKIEIMAPLVIDKTLDDKAVFKALDKGVVYYPSSALPGSKGQTIILGHSAPLHWPKIKYDWVFSRLNDLESGDAIFVYFNGQKYSYSVKNKIFLKRGQKLPQDLTNYDNVLVLISCWPPGKDLRRIAVVASII
jgi:LPXTG-site transpeptidase (sortase) family protein